MVDAHLFADSYAIGSKNFRAFMDQHIDDPDVVFHVIDNSKGGSPAKLPAVPQAALSLNSDDLTARATQVIEERAEKLKPGVVRGGTIGARIWGRPKEMQGAKSLRRVSTSPFAGRW